MMRGAEKFFMDLIRFPKEVHACVREVTETLKEYCTAIVETGVHAIMFDTLFASRTIMSESMWDEFEGVYIEEIADHVHALGCQVMIHNCGGGPYMKAQIDRLNPIAFSFNHLDKEFSSFEEMKEEYRGKLTLIGHIDPGSLMTASLEEIEAESKRQIDTFKKDGGFILATGCEYPAPLNFDAAKVMVKTAKEYGKY